MNRKKFLATATGLGALVPAVQARMPAPVSEIRPPYLKVGDTIGITSPAGFILLNELTPAIDLMKSWGFKIKIGATIGTRYLSFGGTDDARTHDMQLMLDDDSINAVMCARGGYGMLRIIDRLNFEKFSKKPKWILGFSDITVLHSHINRNFGIATIHSKMCNSFPDNWNSADTLEQSTILSIKTALTGVRSDYSIIPSGYNRGGQCEGALAGGNLKTLETLSGTASDLYLNGKILFLEDTGEYLYSIDRMMLNLKRSGKLIGLKGLLIGGFKIKPDDPGEEFGIPLQDIILSAVKEYSFPVCFDFPVGHQKNNFAVKCGVRHTLEVNPGKCRLTEVIPD